MDEFRKIIFSANFCAWKGRVVVLDEKRLLRRWRTALDSYNSVDAEVRQYCEDNGVVVEKCDCCGGSVFAVSRPEHENVLRWNFCSDDCKRTYWNSK